MCVRPASCASVGPRGHHDDEKGVTFDPLPGVPVMVGTTETDVLPEILYFMTQFDKRQLEL